MIFVGDLGQIPPVKDRVSYDSRAHAKVLWEYFKILITFKKIYRQDGENSDQNNFCQFLTNIRDAQPKIEDWKLLMS